MFISSATKHRNKDWRTCVPFTGTEYTYCKPLYTVYGLDVHEDVYKKLVGRSIYTNLLCLDYKRVFATVAKTERRQSII